MTYRGHGEGGVEYLEKQVRRGQLLNKGWPACNSRFYNLVTAEGQTQRPFFSSVNADINSPTEHLLYFKPAAATK